MNGRVAYAVARRSKTGALAIFVSHDGGRNFEVHDLDLVRADSDDEEQYWEHTQSSVRLESFARRGGTARSRSFWSIVTGGALIVADEQGRLLSGSKAPDERALVSAVGMRAFALSVNSRKTWESLDGGVTWQSLSRFPARALHGRQRMRGSSCNACRGAA